MGRSVSYPSGAIVAYATFETDAEDDYDQAAEDWDYFKDTLREEAKAAYPSMYDDDDWLGREDHVLMSNQHAHFGVSEYCGLVAVWLVVRGGAENPELAEAWVNRTAAKFCKRFETLVRTGTMSNGVGVFQHVATA